MFERYITASYANSSFNLIISKTALEHGIEFLASLLKLLKPQGRIAITSSDTNQIIENLKLAGFVKTSVQSGAIVSEKPNYEVGSAAKLSFGKNSASKQAIAAVWKLDQNDDEQEEINADDLLDEEDKIKPDPSTLKGEKKNLSLIYWNYEKYSFPISVCGTTGKRKACKDCSCGLAEELASENGAATNGNETQKSSCGSVRIKYSFSKNARLIRLYCVLLLGAPVLFR